MFLHLPLISFLIVLLCTAPIYAQDESPAGEIVAAQTVTKDSTQNSLDTRIEVDDEQNLIRFIINGEEVMRIDSEEGLQVKENINYGGLVKDIGEDNYPVGSKYEE